MPVIRDYAFNYQSTATNGWIDNATPAYASGDLLVGLVTNDSTTAPISIAGGPIPYCFGCTAGSVFTDYTTAANNATAGDVLPLSATPALNSGSYYGSTAKFCSLAFTFTTAGSVSITGIWEYWNGSAWATLTTNHDKTTGMTVTTITIGQSVGWEVPGDWATTTVNSVSAYWIRFRISAFTSSTTNPLASQVWLGYFQQLYSVANSVGNSLIYKYATASEPGEYKVFAHLATSDTGNSCIVSIRNVHPNIPFATTIATNNSYADTNLDLYQALNNTTTQISQSFLAVASRVASVRLFLRKVGSATGYAYAHIYTHSGTFGTSSVPTGVSLSISDALDVSTLTTSGQWITFSFPWHRTLTATNFCVVLSYTGTATDYIEVGYDSTGTHGGNKATYAGSWTAQSGHDLIFEVNTFTYGTSTTSASKANMPTMTTSKNNSLLLYLCAHSAASVPSILEGPVTFLVGKDGSAHGDGISWSVQPTAGTTPAAVGYSAMSAAAASLAVVAVNPPDSDVVVPGYCAADTSVYVSPFTGAAFNSDAAPANTITTQVTGQKINGTTLTNMTNTTYTLPDYGINTYHAMARIAGITTSNTWAGWCTSVVARTTLAGLNLLFHISPATPIAIQTTDSVALAQACGMAIGLGSSVANFKFWHVFGSGTKWGAGAWTPVVINTSNTTGVIQSDGSLNASSITRIAFAVSAKVVAPIWLIGSVWGLNTVTVAGGVAAEPLDISGIESAASAGHERRSCIIQGKNQLLVQQPLQIGNGGTNPVYLSLDATAIEFPELYNKAAKVVTYSSIENFAGITYYAGASDTIYHVNSVISSPSKYHWNFHASSSGSATYDFSGLSVIGAGTITLHASINLTEVTWNKCSEITAAGNILTGCNFVSSTGTASQGAISITGANQTALQTALDKLVNCSWTNNVLTAGALRIIYTGAAASISLDIDTGTFFGNTADIRWEAAASSPLTLNVGSNCNLTTASPYSATNSNTVTFIAGAVTVSLVAQTVSGTKIQDAQVLLTTSSTESNGLPFETTVTITNSGTTATVSHTIHRMASSDKIKIKGASHYQNNGVFSITKINDNSYSYTMPSAPGTNPTGIIKATFVFLYGTTDVNGLITMSRVLSVNQPVIGWARKSSTQPYYKTAPVSGNVSSTTGASFSALMIPDE